MFRTAPILAAVSAFAAAAALFAQAPSLSAPPVPPAQQPRTVVTTTLVIVPVTVKDSRGELVGDLTRDDFRILEDNTERRIATFSADPVPLSAVVLLDNNLPEKQARQVQSSLVTIAAAFGPEDEVAFVSYDQFPDTVLDFSKDNDKLFTQLKRFEIGSHSTFVNPDPAMATVPVGQSNPGSASRVQGPPKFQNSANLNDALYAAGQMLKDRGRDRRKIIFLVSDGSNSGASKHSPGDIDRALLQADVTVFSVSVQRSVPFGKSLLQHGAAALDSYAHDTGGDTFYAARQNDLDRLYKTVTEEARNQYTLTFQPSPADFSKDFHEIEVRVDRSGLSVSSRDGYYLSALTVGH